MTMDTKFKILDFFVKQYAGGRIFSANFTAIFFLGDSAVRGHGSC